MESLAAGDLTIELTVEPTRILCVWQGKSNERQPAKLLGPYFDELIQAASQRSLPIEMHFEELDHFNSATITVIIRLIQLTRRDGVKLVMTYAQDLKWQRLSFDALRVFDKHDELFILRPV